MSIELYKLSTTYITSRNFVRLTVRSCHLITSPKNLSDITVLSKGPLLINRSTKDEVWVTIMNDDFYLLNPIFRPSSFFFVFFFFSGEIKEEISFHY